MLQVAEAQADQFKDKAVAWVQSEEIHSIYNPANLKEHIQDICLATSSDAKNAVLAARNASEIWSNTETLKRISKLHQIMNDLENQRNEDRSSTLWSKIKEMKKLKLQAKDKLNASKL